MKVRRLTRKKMRCLITVIQNDKWESVYEELAQWFAAHGFLPSNLSREYREVFECSGSARKCASHVQAFLSWIDEKRHLNQKFPPPWAVVATGKQIVDNWKDGAENLPTFILGEFFNTVFLDEAILAFLRELAPERATKFRYWENFGVYAWKWVAAKTRTSREVPEKPRQGDNDAEEVELTDMRNGTNAPPQRARIEVDGFSELKKLVTKAYSDISLDPDRKIGGLNALILLSAEKNQVARGAEPKGTFVVYNARAVNLEISKRRDSISNLARMRKLDVLEVTAEPTEEASHELSDSDESQR